MSSKYKLVLFDLDGVIVDSKRNMEVSWATVQAAFEIDTPFERYFECIGIPFEQIMVRLGLRDMATGIKMVYDLASSCRVDLVTPYRDSVEVIATIRKKGLRTGIVTSKDEARTLEIIRKLDLLFDVVECPDGKGRGKPNPDPLLHALIRCQLDPAEAVYVGDMAVDQECARRAGIEYIHAGWGYGSCEAEVKRASRPEEILKLIF